MVDIAHSALTGSNLHEPKGVATAAAGQVYVADGSGSGTWTTQVTTVPIGAVQDYAGATGVPAGWLACYGQALSRTTYSALFARLSTAYGSGDGSTTFNLPDLRGRVVAGFDDMGGTSSNRLRVAFDGRNYGGTGGTEGSSITQGNLPNCDFALSATAVSNSTSSTTTSSSNVYRATGTTVANTGAGVGPFSITDGVPGTYTSTTSTSTTTSVSGTAASGGSGTALSVVQPTAVMYKIIYTGVI